MTGPRRRWHPPLDPEDAALWEAVKRSVKPLRPQVPAHRGPAPVPVPEHPPAQQHPHPHPPRHAPEAHARPKPKRAPSPAPLDRTVKRRLARGDLSIDRRIDLHGMTQAEAHRALAAALLAAHRSGERVVLVITGKGGSPRAHPDPAGERGVLRRAVPQWLSGPEMRAFVIAFAEAAIGHGGAGALYVHVRRRREDGAG